jgi:hypothetical protein
MTRDFVEDIDPDAVLYLTGRPPTLGPPRRAVPLAPVRPLRPAAAPDQLDSERVQPDP